MKKLQKEVLPCYYEFSIVSCFQVKDCNKKVSGLKGEVSLLTVAQKEMTLKLDKASLLRILQMNREKHIIILVSLQGKQAPGQLLTRVSKDSATVEEMKLRIMDALNGGFKPLKKEKRDP